MTGKHVNQPFDTCLEPPPPPPPPPPPVPTMRGARKQVQVTGTRFCCVGFVVLGSIIICRLYKLTLSDQAQVALAAENQSCRFSVNSFTMRAFACGWGVGKSNFLPEPEPALGGPNHNHHNHHHHHHHHQSSSSSSYARLRLVFADLV